jgi:hypothetical protein
MSLPPLVRDWAPRVLAVLVFLSAAYLIFVLTNLPVATRVEAVSTWKAMRGEALTVGLAPGTPGPGRPVLSLNGPPGKDVSVWFDRARFGEETRRDLAALGFADIAAQSPAGWVSHAGGSGRAAVGVSLEPAGPRPALTLTPTGHGAVAEVVLRARDARMILRLEASLDPAAPEPELFGPNRAWEVRMSGAGGFPVEVVVPPGAYAVLRLPEASVGAADFRMGEATAPDRPALLRAATLDVQVPDEGKRLEACGATPGAIAWTTTHVPEAGCRSTLRVVDLKLARDGVAVEVNGLGFVAEDGEAAVLPLQKITDNPLISMVLGAAYAGLAAWAGRMLMRKRRQAAAAPDNPVVN